MLSLFKSDKGKKEIIELYEEKLSDLNLEFEYLKLETSFGLVNIITLGEASSPPLILLHGSNGCAPVAIEAFPNLQDSFRVYAVDILAQPNKSEENRISMKDDSYGAWMFEIIERLALTNVTMLGFSFCGLVILKALEYNESKIKEVYLSCPAYIVNGNPLKALLGVFLPMQRYIKTQKMKYVVRFVDELFSYRDPFAIKYLSKVLLHFDMDYTPVPVISKRSANRIKTPIFLYGSDNDLLFPGKKMLKRASKIFPSLIESNLWKDTKHVTRNYQNGIIEDTIFRNQFIKNE